MKLLDTAYPTVIRDLHKHIYFTVYYPPGKNASGYHYRRQAKLSTLAVVKTIINRLKRWLGVPALVCLPYLRLLDRPFVYVHPLTWQRHLSDSRAPVHGTRLCNPHLYRCTYRE